MPDTRSYAERKARETYGTDEGIQRRIRARESERLWAEAMRRYRIERLKERMEGRNA